MASIFSKIVAGEIPSYKIAESECCYAFLDIRPLQPGHTLVIPKVEVDYFFDLPDDLLSSLMQFAKPIAHAIQQEVPCERIGVSVVGLEVPHAHVHLIPINGVADMDFNRNPIQMNDGEFVDLAQRIARHLG